MALEIIQDINIDLINSTLETIYSNQNESNARTANCNILLEGDPWDIPSDVSVFLRMHKPNHCNIYRQIGVDNFGSINKNIVSFPITESMTKAAGRVEFNLEFISGNDVLYATRSFLRILPIAFDHEIIKDSDEYLVLKNYVEDSKGYSNISKSYAVGTNNVIREGDSEDNAKYYSEQSNTYMTKASESEKVAIEQATISTNKAKESSDSAISAANSAKSAKSSEDNSKISETNAADSAVESATSASNSANSASVSTNKAKEASDSASASALSETNAKASEAASKISETNAKASETASANSEKNAKISEDNAKSSETASNLSAQNAKTSETNAKASETASANSEKNAKNSEVASAISETNAKESETNASMSETNAFISEQNASSSANSSAKSAQDSATSESNAKQYATDAHASEENASNYASQASISASTASNQADIATTKASEASTSAMSSLTYSNQAKDYRDQCKSISQGLEGALLPMGTISFEELPTTDIQSGYMYNISNDFTSDERFKDGVGKSYTSGTNVYYTSDGLWDVLIGDLEKYAFKTDLEDHIGNKSNPHGVTKSQVGLGNVPNVVTNDQTVTYIDSSTLSTLSSGEKMSVAFGKIKKAISDLISHIADTTKHITSSERTLWNTVSDKVDKVDGKGLSTNDYTTTEKNKLNGIESGANKYIHPGSGTNPHGTTKSDVGLGNVGNFKAVSTVASQGLTDTEKANARDNIGAQVAGNYATSVHNHDTVYSKLGHTHTKSQITDFPSSMPASDVSSWAKASTKPSYSWSEITSKPSVPESGDYSSDTIEALLKKIQNTSPKMGSASITKDTRIASMWWNFFYVPHRTGSGGDNGDYGTLLLFPMTGNGTSYIVRASKDGVVSSISSIITSANIESQSVASATKVNNHTVNADVPSGAKFTDTNTWRPQPDWNATSGDAVIKNKPTIPSVGNGTVTITQNGTTKGTFTMNQSGNTTIALTDTNTDTNTWIAFKGATTSAAGTAGYAPAPSAGAANRYLRSDGTWSVPPDTNTTYTLAGLMGSSAKGSATQPVYWNGSAWANTTYTLGKSVPSNAVFTDTNTWRGIQNNLTSTSTTDSLSAYQGKLLNDKIATINSNLGDYKIIDFILSKGSATVLSDRGISVTSRCIVFLQIGTVSNVYCVYNNGAFIVSPVVINQSSNHGTVGTNSSSKLAIWNNNSSNDMRVTLIYK